jgi:hypothetical protein
MKRFLSAAPLIVLALAACGGPVPDTASAGIPERWRVVQVENRAERAGIVHYAGGQQLETALMRVEHLGELPAKGKAPFLVLAGYGCNDCDINRNLYIHSPSDGPIKGEAQPRYTYPGTLIEWETPSPAGEVIERSRVFVGECVSQAGPVVLWVTERPASKGPPAQVAEIVHVEADTLRTDRLGDPQRVLHAAEQAAGRRRCRELAPLEQMREP